MAEPLRYALIQVRKELRNIQQRVEVGQLESAMACIGLAAVTVDVALAAPVVPRCAACGAELKSGVCPHWNNIWHLAKVAAPVAELPTPLHSVATEDTKLKHVRRIIDLYFAPWGAAKAAEWEELSGDGPFSAENALRLLRAAMEGEKK